jgi:hypothetical protein
MRDGMEGERGRNVIMEREERGERNGEEGQIRMGNKYGRKEGMQRYKRDKQLRDEDLKEMSSSDILNLYMY